MLLKDQIKLFISLLKAGKILDWRNQKQITKEKEAIKNAFPLSLRQEVEIVINVLSFNRNIHHQYVDEIKVTSLIHQNKTAVYLIRKF